MSAAGQRNGRPCHQSSDLNRPIAPHLRFAPADVRDHLQLASLLTAGGVRGTAHPRVQHGTVIGTGKIKIAVTHLDAHGLTILRDGGVIRRPEDLGIHKRDATRDLLAARSVKDLVRWSGGLYDPPRRFRHW